MFSSFSLEIYVVSPTLPIGNTDEIKADKLTRTERIPKPEGPIKTASILTLITDVKIFKNEDTESLEKDLNNSLISSSPFK